MKRIVCFILFLCFVFPTGAEVKIPEDFYINGGDVMEDNAVIAENVLPDALFVRITEGEKRRLYADILPKDTTEKKLVWRICDGYSSVTISPGEADCMLFGKKCGNARIRVTAPGGAFAEISVEVAPIKKMIGRVEELMIPEREPAKSDGKAADRVVRTLLILSGTMFLIAAILGIRGRKKNEKG